MSHMPRHGRPRITSPRPEWRPRTRVLILLSSMAALGIAMFVGAAVAAASIASSPSSPWIQSDQTDYAPGSAVTLTGGNWVPGDNIHIYVNDSVGTPGAVTSPTPSPCPARSYPPTRSRPPILRTVLIAPAQASLTAIFKPTFPVDRARPPRPSVDTRSCTGPWARIPPRTRSVSLGQPETGT